MLKDTIENRNTVILKALGFKHNSVSRSWKLKVNSTIVILDDQVNISNKQMFETLLKRSINERSRAIEALMKKKSLLIKLLKTVY